MVVVNIDHDIVISTKHNLVSPINFTDITIPYVNKSSRAISKSTVSIEDKSRRFFRYAVASKVAPDHDLLA